MMIDDEWVMKYEFWASPGPKYGSAAVENFIKKKQILKNYIK